MATRATGKTSTATPAADAPNLTPTEVVEDAIADLQRAIEGHTSNNPFALVYRLTGSRLTIAEVVAIRSTGATLYSGPTPAVFAASTPKPTDEERAGWYYVPARAGAADRIARGCGLLGVTPDHVLAMWAPGASDLSALAKAKDPFTEAEALSKAAEVKAAEKVKAERERVIKKSVTDAVTLANLDLDTLPAWRKAIEAGADVDALSEAWTNAKLTPPADESADQQ
ncbi:hypothetical protein [Nonomuraea lactucae]|uniref:hypothetical protein n=1 Tax=Nonomuraea lactucae TaxID=2249762 RepID=UPI000DE48041|nr:hypothetical protein [Nonomuraea lactucae]